jgi:glucoamylase
MSDDPREPFGAPGIPPRWTSSSKEGIGTAFSDASRVWFTISHGILNEVYFPTVDRPQIRDLQFLVTDGETFCHEEKRDLAHQIHPIEGASLGCEVTARDPAGRYRIVKQIVADPGRACVLVHVRLQAAEAWRERLRIYALLAPHLGGAGAGNSARRARAARKDVLVAWKDSTFLALGASTRLLETSCGYVGFSDGWRDLKDNFRLDWRFDEVREGNIALTARIEPDPRMEFTLGLAFGDSLHSATTVLTQSLSEPFARRREGFVRGWREAAASLPDLARATGDGGRLFRASYELLLAHEDKTYKGAFIASASIPWGEAKGDEDLGGYHLVWTRDMVQTASALIACGNPSAALRALVYLAVSQQADGGFFQNFWVDGTPYWRGKQLDEVAFPVMLAWRVWKAGALADFDPYPMVKAAASFMIREGPATAQERWEEASGYSPSTLAAVIAALVCAADFARDRGEAAMAAFIEDQADFLESRIERWTVTREGRLVPGIPRHYIRILPVSLDDLSPEEDPERAWLAIANRPPGARWRFEAKDVVDAGFLELVRYGIRRGGDALVEDSLGVIDRVLKVETPLGPCWHRYNHDGYGNRDDGGPFVRAGRGRAWPLLTGERGHYELAAGRSAARHRDALEAFSGRGALLPEQVWDREEPQLGMRLGRPTGSAMPLAWAHAEYLRLVRSIADGAPFELIAPVAERYRAGRGRKDLEVWKPVRQARRVARGDTLRVQAPAPFRLHWTLDEWRHAADTVATGSGLELWYVDIPVPEAQAAPIRFTFYWPEGVQGTPWARGRGTWEGHDYQVAAVA